MRHNIANIKLLIHTLSAHKTWHIPCNRQFKFFSHMGNAILAYTRYTAGSHWLSPSIRCSWSAAANGARQPASVCARLPAEQTDALWGRSGRFQEPVKIISDGTKCWTLHQTYSKKRCCIRGFCIVTRGKVLVQIFMFACRTHQVVYQKTKVLVLTDFYSNTK